MCVYVMCLDICEHLCMSVYECVYLCACMSAFHGRAWGLEEDVAAHVQSSEAAGKNKLTADEVDDICGMLQVRGLLPPPTYVCICVCTHSYTKINTGTQTRKAMITLSLCVVICMH